LSTRNRSGARIQASVAAQDLAGQLAQLQAAGCEKILCEKITGAHTDRPQPGWRQ
jgi:hypothetical protein